MLSAARPAALPTHSLYGDSEPTAGSTLSYAKRKELHIRQKKALLNGATIYQVPYGYMTNAQAKAKRYAREHGALVLPLGFDARGFEPF